MPDVPEVETESFAGLLHLLLDRQGVDRSDRARWLSENAIDPLSDQSVGSRQSTHDLLNMPRSGWVRPQTIRALAAALNVQPMELLAANARELNIPGARLSSTSSYRWLPSELDSLSRPRKAIIREIAIAFAHEEGIEGIVE